MIRTTTFALVLAALASLSSAAPAASRDAGARTSTPLAPPALSSADLNGDKIFDDLAAHVAQAPKNARLKVIVALDSTATKTQIASVERAVGPLRVTQRFTIIHGFAASARPEQVRALARLSAVAHVEEDLAVQAFNDSAQQSFGVSKARLDAPGLDGNLDGNVDAYTPDDLVAAVVDTGIDAGHADLDEGKVLAFVDCMGASCVARSPLDDNGHGTHVSATIAGDGDGRPDHRYRGVAPAAALVGVKVLDQFGGGSLSTITAGINWVVDHKAEYGIEAINLSVGAVGCGSSVGTDAASQAVNAANAAGMVVSVAAGNSGPGACTIGTPAGAAGALTVGAMADLEAPNAFGSVGPGFYQAAFSSRGPTQDGRTKPDISAPGVGITSAAAGTTNGYAVDSGTSMAAPFVAGVALLMLDANPTLTPQDVKERMMATAVDWGVTGPDSDYGAGRLDAYAAIDAADPTSVLGTPPTLPPHLRLDGNLAGSGAEAEYLLEVPSLQFPLAATLITPGWAGGMPDLDLELVAPDGTVVARGETNLRQDQFGLQPTQTGIYSLRVRSFSGSGSFFVDVSGAVLPVPAPSLRHSMATVSDAIALGGDGDGVLEPGEPFTLQERLTNRGAAPATGVTGALSALSPGATVTQGVSPYGSIASGATAANTTPFAGNLAGGAPCGQAVRLSLVLNSDQGPTTVPITLPTGTTGPAVSPRNSTPTAIPDNSSLLSTLDVPAAGRLKDVDVALGEVRHTWDGDLSFELTSPAGTSVLLVNRRGLNGDDFLNTVLDDEAGTKIFAGTAPFTGRFRPEEPLSAFDGEQQQGPWTLKVTDHAARDVGTLMSWGTDLSPAVCQFVPPPSISIGDASLVEGNSGTATMTFTVSLDRASTSTVRVDYATADGTAVQPGDYTAAGGTLTFAPGQTAQTLSVQVAGDRLDELDEQFEVRLTNVVDAFSADLVGVGTIVDDDHSPIAESQGSTTAEDTAKTITLVATDLNGDPLSYTVVEQPTHGTLGAPAGNAVTYTPAANFNGTDSFTFKASDGVNDSNVATATITVTPVNDAPLAADGTASVNEDAGPVAIDLGALASDLETADANLTYTIVGAAAYGSLSTTGAVRNYTPNSNFNGTDSFTYKVSDRGDPDNCGAASVGCAAAKTSETKQVTITVDPVNDVPIANDDAVATGRNAPKDIAVLGNDTDVDLDALTVTAVTNPSHGTAAVNPDGTVRYAPDMGYVGADSFVYTISDGKGGTDTATVNITVTSGTAPVAANDAYTVAEDGTLSVPASGVLANDTDADLDALTAVLENDVTSGTLLLNANGAFIYTPAMNLNGPITFRYRASDAVLSSAVATVTIMVTPVNDTPLANTDTAVVNEDAAVAIDLGALVGDIETADANLTYTIVDPPSNGNLGGAGASRSYSPNANFNGTDSFTYKVGDRGDPDNCGPPTAGCDAAKTSATRRVTITVDPVNDAPLAADGTASVNEDAGPVAIDLGALASDLETADPNLTYTIVGAPAHGSLSTTGAVRNYTPNPNFNGADAFTYKVGDRGDPDNCGAPSAGCDAAKTSATKQVTITVVQAPAPPPPPPPPPPPSPPPSPPPPPPPPVTRAPKAGVGSTQILVTASGLAPVELTCAGSACRGTLILETQVAATKLASTSPQKTKKLVLGRGVFSLRAGQKKTVKIKLTKAGLRLLQRRGKLRAKATLVVKGGKRTTRAVTLVARG